MNVLVADDDRMSREMLRRIIESDEAHTVTLAEDGEQAWKFLCDTSKHFDVGIFDINMPKIDGLRLIERIRSTSSLRNMPAILCTAAADRTTVGRASSLAVAHYIIKPYTKGVILDKLQTVKAEIAKAGLEERDQVLKRLGVDDETYRVLVQALAGEIKRWVQLTRYTSDLTKFAKLAARSAGLRGACVNFGLSSLVSRLEEVEFTLVSDSAASQGQQSPLLLAQMAPIFELLEEEVLRVERLIALTE
jgi:YesN/AraC family two-component response regulator